MATIVAVFALHRPPCQHAGGVSHNLRCECDPDKVVVTARFVVHEHMGLEARIGAAHRSVVELTRRAAAELQAEAES